MHTNTDRGGVVLDFDGVTGDTQALHTRIEHELLNELGIIVDPFQLKLKYSGIPDNTMFTEILISHNFQDVDAFLPQLIEKKWIKMNSFIDREGLHPVNGSVDLIKNIHRGGYKLAIASGSPKEFLIRALDFLEISQYFTTIVSSDEVCKGKPSPDIFIEAVRRLEIDVEECVVIEDGLSGMQAALAAKIKCIGYVPDSNCNSEVIWPADIIVSSISDITIGMIQQLISSSQKIS
jgi:HAD superfamily hydrolase (TIGR01509 family)